MLLVYTTLRDETKVEYSDETKVEYVYAANIKYKFDHTSHYCAIVYSHLISCSCQILSTPPSFPSQMQYKQLMLIFF